eukprot:gene24029-9606_t
MAGEQAQGVNGGAPDADTTDLMKELIAQGVNGGAPDADSTDPMKELIVLAACAAGELLPQTPKLPADVFTACLTTPIKVSLRWFCSRSLLRHNGLNKELIDRIPGRQTDRKTPLGELNWIFTAITDTIAWNMLPRALFQKLFRSDLLVASLFRLFLLPDLLVASLFRNFLLAERIMVAANCTPISYPRLPPTHQHPMWQAWDLAAEMCLMQIPTLLNDPTAEFQPSSFFTEQLTAFELWLSHGSKDKRPPEQLPIVLQAHKSKDKKPPEQLPIVLQVGQVHRLRALVLLGRFLDMGPWAVDLALSVGIFPYVLKLLQTTSVDLTSTLVFIWCKILALDKSCQVDLVKDSGHLYFIKYLDTIDGQVDLYSRAQAAFILSVVCDTHPKGQAMCASSNLLMVLLKWLRSMFPPQVPFDSPGHALLLKWLCLCLGKLCQDMPEVSLMAIREGAADLLVQLLTVASPGIRAAAVFGLGCLVHSCSEGSTDPAAAADMSISMTPTLDRLPAEQLIANAVVYDPSVLVRSELAVLYARFVRGHASLVQETLQQQQRKLHDFVRGSYTCPPPHLPTAPRLRRVSGMGDRPRRHSGMRDPPGSATDSGGNSHPAVTKSPVDTDTQGGASSMRAEGAAVAALQAQQNGVPHQQQPGQQHTDPSGQPTSQQQQQQHQQQQQQTGSLDSRSTTSDTSTSQSASSPTSPGNATFMRKSWKSWKVATASIIQPRPSVGLSSSSSSTHGSGPIPNSTPSPPPTAIPENDFSRPLFLLKSTQAGPIPSAAPSPPPTAIPENEFSRTLFHLKSMQAGSTDEYGQLFSVPQTPVDFARASDTSVSYGSYSMGGASYSSHPPLASSPVGPGQGQGSAPAAGRTTNGRSSAPPALSPTSAWRDTEGAMSRPWTATVDSLRCLQRAREIEAGIARCKAMTVPKLRDKAYSVETGCGSISALCFHPYYPIVCTADSRGFLRITNYNDTVCINSFHATTGSSVNDYQGILPKHITYTNRITLTYSPPPPGSSVNDYQGVLPAHITFLRQLNETSGPILLCGSSDGAVRVWRSYTMPGSQRMATALQAVTIHLPPAHGHPTAFEWSPLRSHLFAAGGSHPEMIYCWDLQYEMCSNMIPMSALAGGALAPSAEKMVLGQVDPNQLCVSCSDSTLRIFDLRNARSPTAVMQPFKHSGKCTGVVFEPAQRTGAVVAASDKGELSFMDIRMAGTGLSPLSSKDALPSYITKTVEASGGVSAMVAHINAPLIATIMTTNVVKVWTDQGEKVGSIRNPSSSSAHTKGPVTCMTFHPYQLLLAAGGGDSPLIDAVKAAHEDIAKSNKEPKLCFMFVDHDGKEMCRWKWGNADLFYRGCANKIRIIRRDECTKNLNHIGLGKSWCCFAPCLVTCDKYPLEEFYQGAAAIEYTAEGGETKLAYFAVSGAPVDTRDVKCLMQCLEAGGASEAAKANYDDGTYWSYANDIKV